MSDDNRHILQAAEEKLERMSAELGRVRNELDRYSKAAVDYERKCNKFCHALLEIDGTGEPKSREIAQKALRKKSP